MSLSKAELLARAAQSHIDAPAHLIKCLPTLCSDEAVEWKVQQVARLQKRARTSFKGFCFASLAVIVPFMAFHPGFFLRLENVTDDFTVWLSMAFIIAGTGTFVILVLAWLHLAVLKAAGGDKASRYALSPIAGTSQCTFALHCVEQGGELPKQWRDIALSERSQLIGLDYAIMQALTWRHEAECAELAAKQSLDEACRKVHGLPTN